MEEKLIEIKKKLSEVINYMMNHDDDQPGTDFCKHIDILVDIDDDIDHLLQR